VASSVAATRTTGLLAATFPHPQLHALIQCGARAPPNAVIRMNGAAIATFVVIGGLVWGGFLLIVATAVGKESRKADQR
jgi:hypothetical protein